MSHHAHRRTDRGHRPEMRHHAHAGRGHDAADGRAAQRAERERGVQGGQDRPLEVALHGQAVHVHRHVEHAVHRPRRARRGGQRPERTRPATPGSAPPRSRGHRPAPAAGCPSRATSAPAPSWDSSRPEHRAQERQAQLAVAGGGPLLDRGEAREDRSEQHAVQREDDRDRGPGARHSFRSPGRLAQAAAQERHDGLQEAVASRAGKQRIEVRGAGRPRSPVAPDARGADHPRAPRATAPSVSAVPKA